MGWVAIPDDVFASAALASVGPRAAWLWVCARAYAGQQGTNGQVPKLVLRLAGATERDAARLVDARLWTTTLMGWLDPSFLDLNATSTERARAREYERTRKAARRAVSSTSATCPDGTTAGSPGGSPANVPSAQDRTGTETEQRDQNLPPCPPSGGGRATLPGIEPKAKRTKAAKGPMPADYQPADDIIALAASLGVDLARETAACRDYFAANGKPMADWHATLRGWVRRAPSFARTTTKGREIQQAAPVNDWIGADKLYGQGYCD